MHTHAAVHATSGEFGDQVSRIVQVWLLDSLIELPRLSPLAWDSARNGPDSAKVGHLIQTFMANDWQPPLLINHPSIVSLPTDERGYAHARHELQHRPRHRLPQVTVMTESKDGKSARDEFVARLGWGFTGMALLVGAAIIACHVESGGRRWQAAAWQFALQVPGSPATWGVIILTGGLLMLAGRLLRRRTVFRAGCFIGFWWFTILCGAAFAAFLTDPDVNPLGAIAWGAFAFVYGSLVTETKVST